VKSLPKGLCAVALLATFLASVSTAAAEPTRSGAMGMNFARASSPETAPSVPDLRLLPDPHKELLQLSRNLKLKKDQRTVVGSILEERAREIRLLFEVASLSEPNRTTLAAQVVQDSNAQIETFLRNKQKRKFDKVLAKGPNAL
jgi:hypothetical protein